MFLLTARRKYITQVVLLIAILSVLVGMVYYFYVPHRYFVLFPIIPAFFLLCGMLNISLFSMAFKMGDSKMLPMFLVSKIIKFCASIFVIILYCFAVRHEALSFIIAFMVYYIPCLVVDTVYFARIEMILKRKKRKK